MRLGLPALALGAASALVACGSGLAFAPDTVTIHGRVVSAGLVLPNAAWWAADRQHLVRAAELGGATPTAPSFTDQSGRFFVYGLGTTYDLTVGRPGDSTDFSAFRALTRRDPALDLPLRGSLPLETEHLDIVWSAPPAAGTKVAYFLDAASNTDVRFVGVAPVDDDPAHGLTATWYGTPSTGAFLNAVVYTVDANGNPNATVAVGFAYVVLFDGRSTTLGVQSSALTGSPVAVSATTPASDWIVDSVTIDVDHGNRSSASTFADLAPSSLPATLTLPDLNANRVVVRGEAHRGAELSTGITLGTATPDQTVTLSVDFQPAPTLSAPADLAANVTFATPFTFEGDGVSEVIFTPVGGGPKARIVTTEKTVTLGMLPDTSAFASGASYSWTVRRWPYIPTTDAFVDGNVELGATSSATSAPRTFTLKN